MSQLDALRHYARIEESEGFFQSVAHKALEAPATGALPQHLAKLKSALYDISSGDFDATDDEVRALMCVIQELHLAVPQQGAEAVNQAYEKGWSDGFEIAESRHTSPQLPPLEARLRDIKLNQEIDAMVREMKQPSDEQINDLALEHGLLSNFDYWSGSNEAVTFARAVLALHAEPVEKMKGEGA